jgi:predicted ATPase
MPRIKIQNFGPIRDSGWIDVKKVTFFIGDQGSGKSTIAKLLSTFLWIEKALFRGDYEGKWFQWKGRFRSTFLAYHRIENYIPSDADLPCEVEYEGGFCSFYFNGKELRIIHNEVSSYSLPQILYVPAERNFVSYVKTAKDQKAVSESLKGFIGDFSAAKEGMSGEVPLPIASCALEYDRLNDTLKLKGQSFKPIKLSESASGFQAVAPLFLVSNHLASVVNDNQSNGESTMTSQEQERFKREVRELYDNKNLSDEQRRLAISGLSGRFKKDSFCNIVEEPEQNLFPESQRKLLFDLLRLNTPSGNRLIITTHSPYLLNALTLSIQATETAGKITGKPDLEKKLAEIVPRTARIRSEDVAIYQLDADGGSCAKLPMPAGIPSDEEYLNKSLAESNELFARMLELEEEAE